MEDYFRLRQLAALERIAAALERAYPIPIEGKSTGEVFYPDYEKDIQDELERVAYFKATGIQLIPSETPPPPEGKDLFADED